MATEEDKPELAPNQWFTEYGMPYTTLILEAEAETAKEHPALAEQPRSELTQFIIDQETAVARDFYEGRISEAEFDAYKAKSQELLDASADKIEAELDELVDDVEDWKGDFEVSLKDYTGEHEAEFTTLAELAKERELTEKDVSLNLLADTLGVTVNGLDDLFERLPPHIHDVLEVVKEDSVNNAHTLLDERAELSSAEGHSLERDAERLDAIEPVFEAKIDEAHEAIDQDFERMDQDFAEAQGYVEDIQDHARMNPELTVEHMPTRHTDDYDLPEQIEDETGLTDA